VDKKEDFELIFFRVKIEANFLESACGLSACRFGSYTEIKWKNAGFPRTGRAEVAPPCRAGTRAALTGRVQGRPPAGLRIFLPTWDAVCGLASLYFYMPALPALKKQYDPDGKDGKYLKSIKGWDKKEKVWPHSLLDKQKFCHFSRRKVGAVLAIYWAVKWRRFALLPLLTKKRAGRIRDFLNPAVRLIINSCNARKIGEIMVGGHWEQKPEIHMGKRCGRNFAQIQIASLRQKVKGSGAGVAARLSEREHAGIVGAKQKGEEYGNLSPRVTVISLQTFEAMCAKGMLISELRYGLQYAAREESDTSQASFSDKKLSQGIPEAYLSYLLAAAHYLFGVSFPSRQEQCLGDEIPRKAWGAVRDIKSSSQGIGRDLCGTQQWLLVRAALNGAANILRGMYRRLDIELGKLVRTLGIEGRPKAVPADTPRFDRHLACPNVLELQRDALS
jgi:hypothetical protein